ncbi:hypothetical protein B0H13DRAFT_1734586 [Mycena leptocephala]|nr:hypothetical protein B0H13DRAFT_1734586 [Mycena leptocephala]
MISALQADRTRLADIEVKIQDLERSLAAFRAEKTLLQERLDSYKYPILTLPNEITSEIFIHFLPIYPLRSPIAGILSPTNLTQICRQWREVALATPALWRAMDVILYDHLHPFKQEFAIFDIWLSRSCSCPLSIYLGQNDHFRSFPPFGRQPLLTKHAGSI